MLFLVGGIFLVLGICFFVFPDWIRRHDSQLRRYVADEDGHRIWILIFGILSIVLGLVMFVIAIFAPDSLFYK